MAEPDVVTSKSRISVWPSTPFLTVRDRAQLFALSALALLVSLLGLLVLAAMLTKLPLSMFVVVLVRTSAVQNFVVLLWAAISGSLFVLGAGRLAWMRRARIVAFVGGALGPWVVSGVAQLEGHFWPSLRETSGPLDHPLLTLPMLFGALLTPWLAGRAARARAQSNKVSKMMPRQP